MSVACFTERNSLGNFVGRLTIPHLWRSSSNVPGGLLAENGHAIFLKNHSSKARKGAFWTKRFFP